MLPGNSSKVWFEVVMRLSQTPTPTTSLGSGGVSYGDRNFSVAPKFDFVIVTSWSKNHSINNMAVDGEMYTNN